MTAAANQGSRFRDLSEPCRRLLRLMQDVNFGRITFRVRQGERAPTGRWRTLRTVKLAGGENGPRPEVASDDFELRKEHVALFEQLARVRDGACVTIEVKHGLPFIIEIEQDHQAA